MNPDYQRKNKIKAENLAKYNFQFNTYALQYRRRQIGMYVIFYKIFDEDQEEKF